MNAFTREPPPTCLRLVSAGAWPRRALAATPRPERTTSGRGSGWARLVQILPTLPFSPANRGLISRPRLEPALSSGGRSCGRHEYQGPGGLGAGPPGIAQATYNRFFKGDPVSGCGQFGCHQFARRI